MKGKILLLLLVSCASAQAEPILSSWFTSNSAVRARVIQETSTIGTHNITPVNTWPTAGIVNNNNGGAAQTVAVYADVQRIRYDASFVYINSSGLASYTMGPWLQNATTLFGFWPVSQNYTIKIPRSPASPVPTTKTPHAGGPIGLMVNGVVIYDLGDAFAFVQSTSSPVTGNDAMMQTNATHPWWRNALAVEVVTFDPGFAHQPGMNGQYHYHAEPKAVRYQLGDNMQSTYDPVNHTYSYTEDTSNLHHSPIIGWCYDGYPIYGPYGYTSPLDPNSGVSRMRSGFVLRNAANHATYGVTDITATGRTSLAKWAFAAESPTGATFNATTGNYDLPQTSYGPATNYVNNGTTYSLGRYVGDYDYLGDRGQIQGPTGPFDLDQYNGRMCKTPEFPDGTYAYFVTNDAAGNPVFPYMLGKQYYGTKTGTNMGVVVPAGATDYFNNGGLNTVEAWVNSPAVDKTTGNVTLTWSSVEGGTYKVEASNDLGTWNTLVSALPAPANTVIPAPPNVITQTSYTDPGAVNNAKRFYRATRNP